MARKVVVTGAAGQLGASMTRLLEAEYDVVALTRAGLDITSHEAVVDRVMAERPAPS